MDLTCITSPIKIWEETANEVVDGLDVSALRHVTSFLIVQHWIWHRATLASGNVSLAYCAVGNAMTRETTKSALSHQASRSGQFCGVARAAALIGDVWTLLLIRDLENGPRRFSELEASTGISPRVLTDRLRELLARGMVTRHMFNEIPPRVEYTLTEKGLAACPVVDALRAYGDAWLMSDECPKSDHTEPTVPSFEAVDATTVADA